jgi:hypothetical protein
VNDGMSLGQAIQDLRPSAEVTTEVRRAEQDATIFIDENDGARPAKAKAAPKPKTAPKPKKSGGGE